MSVIRRALFLGRFQPFHNGHLSVVNSMIDSDDVDEILIGIGSAQEGYTAANPFTAGERFEMINNTLNQECDANKDIHIMPVMDTCDNYKYMSYLRTILPEFHVYYGSNDLMLRLCENSGIETRKVVYNNDVQRSGTWIRQNIKSNKLDWRDYVPEAVTKYILGNARLYQWTEGQICYK